MGAVHGMREPRERQVLGSISLWGKRVARPCHCATRQPLPCPNVCAHPSSLSLPTSLVPKEESSVEGVLTGSESPGAASHSPRAAAGGWYRQHPEVTALWRCRERLMGSRCTEKANLCLVQRQHV